MRIVLATVSLNFSDTPAAQNEMQHDQTVLLLDIRISLLQSIRILIIFTTTCTLCPQSYPT